MSEEMDQFLDQKDEEPQEVRPLGSELYEWLQMLMGCVLAAVLLFTCLGRLTRVDGESMNNTLQHGEMMLVWSLGYQPQQGDIVVVNKTTAEFLGGKAIVKRVIATGGQTVDIDYGTSTVYVDGVALDEPYIREPMGVPYTPSAYDSTGVQTHWEVPEGSIFVMGDNRNHSMDSRDPGVGVLTRKDLIGRAWVRIYPFDKMGVIRHE